MSAWASWLLNGFQIVHFMPFYAQNYAQNYALIMQNYALVIMLCAQLCKRALLMHRTMTDYAHYVTSYAIICPNYAQLCTIMLKLCPKLCIIMPRNQAPPMKLQTARTKNIFEIRPDLGR